MKELINASAFEQAEAYILDIPKFTTKNSLSHTEELLKLLGEPLNGMNIIHVAGTNGKGSACAYLNAMFMAQGKRAGLFTSPHLVSMCERMQVGDEMISEAEFVTVFEQVKEAAYRAEKEQGLSHPTFFEFLFLMACVYFKKKQVDVIILETGLGGRLDATNVCKPKVSVITEIGMDHMAYLGDTFEAIASEKAGIIKENVPVVYADKRRETTKVIEKKAEEMHSFCVPVTKECYRIEKSRNKSIDFFYQSSYYSIKNNNYICITMPKWAPYQYENAAIALRAYEQFVGERVSQAVAEAIASVKWPCRFEEILPGIIVDGAHNEDGIQAFLEAVREDGVKGERTLLFGAVKDKAFEQMLQNVMESKLFSRIVFTGMEEERAVTVDTYATLFAKHGLPLPVVFTSVYEAFEYIRQFACGDDFVYIAGSLYLAGYIKRALKTSEVSDD